MKAFRALLALACAWAFAAPAFAQSAIPQYPGPSGANLWPDVTFNLGRQGGAYAEAAFTLTAGTWTQVAAASTARKKIVVGDATGLGCVFSFITAPSSGEGIPFSLQGTPGSFVIDDPTPTNQIMVRCALGGVVTVISE